MSNKELKLEFIENGRLSVDEMGIIVGGASEGLVVAMTKCGEPGKNYCKEYDVCTSSINKKTCLEYSWVNMDLSVNIPVSNVVATVSTINVSIR